MSGFSPDWLALREPVDHASINAEVRRTLITLLAGRDELAVVDLGCGAGSNLRGLSPWLPGRQSWKLVDYDQRLLDTAKERLALLPSPWRGGDRGVEKAGEETGRVTFRQADFSKGDFAPLIAGADLVTAAALFDLVSAPVIEKLADAVAQRRAIFYTVLTYDGIAAFLPEHPSDRDMREAFNQHQQTDKGFGPAAGPHATGALAKAFAKHGYHIVRGKSPWVLDAACAKLRYEVDAGWANAAVETGRISEAEAYAWLTHRREARDAVTIVGHEDLLALPA